MESITRFITETLNLKINETKSAVARPQDRKFLGFSFTAGPEVKRAIAPQQVLASVLRTIQQRHLDATTIFTDLLCAPQPLTLLTPPTPLQLESHAFTR